MDKEYEDILEALKSHSERNHHFIAQLGKLKPQSVHERLLTYLPFSKSSRPGNKQLESDRTEEVDDVHEVIKDIKQKMQILEEETKQVIQKLSQCAVSKKGEEESSATHFQVYERDGNTAELVTALKNRLPKRCIPDVIENVSKIDINKPLIVLCQSRSRLGPDIDYSLEHFKELDSFTRLAIVILHNKQEHALTTTSSQSKLSDDVKFKNLLIMDAAFTNELKFYDCKMNDDAIASLASFLKIDTPI